MRKKSSDNGKIDEFESLEDFKRRVSLSKDELRTLAELGALNCFAEHRRAAMWKVEEPLHDDLLGSARILRAVSGALAAKLLSQTGMRSLTSGYRSARCRTVHARRVRSPDTHRSCP